MLSKGTKLRGNQTGTKLQYFFPSWLTLTLFGCCTRTHTATPPALSPSQTSSAAQLGQHSAHAQRLEGLPCPGPNEGSFPGSRDRVLPGAGEQKCQPTSHSASRGLNEGGRGEGRLLSSPASAWQGSRPVRWRAREGACRVCRAPPPPSPPLLPAPKRRVSRRASCCAKREPGRARGRAGGTPGISKAGLGGRERKCGAGWGGESRGSAPGTFQPGPGGRVEGLALLQRRRHQPTAPAAAAAAAGLSPSSRRRRESSR